jgi:hypothetical protein
MHASYRGEDGFASQVEVIQHVRRFAAALGDLSDEKGFEFDGGAAAGDGFG